jgi:thiol-disulfide isomerase/thioredoxin
MQRNKFKLTLLFCVAVCAAWVACAAVTVGGTFPNLATQKLEGKLPDSIKGKVVMIDFWASWCGPCGESFPVMDSLQKKYGGQGLVIIAVNEDESKSDMEDFLKHNPVSFTIVRDPKQKLVELAGIGTMPSSFFIDRDGKVAFAHSGFHGGKTTKEYEHEIESLLKATTK